MAATACRRARISAVRFAPNDFSNCCHLPRGSAQGRGAGRANAIAAPAVSRLLCAGLRVMCLGRQPESPTILVLERSLGYIFLMYIMQGELMSDVGVAKIFMHGRSQAVRLPLAFRLPGDRVRVRRVEGGILLEPMVTDIDAWFAAMDRFGDVPFMEEGRLQPPMSAAEDLFE